MKVFRFIFIILFYSVFVTEASACFCAWGGSFLKVANKTPLVAYVKINNYSYSSMDVEIINLIKGNSSLNEVKVWGQGLLLCRPSIEKFKNNRYWILALYESSKDTTINNEGEKYGDYYLSECGAYWLEVKNDSVYGKIENNNYLDPNEKLPLVEFLDKASSLLTSMRAHDLPSNYISLSKNFPNPFNPSTSIMYRVNKQCKVKVILYDCLGREIKILENAESMPGEHFINVHLPELSSGIYYYSLFIDSKYFTSKKMVLIK